MENSRKPVENSVADKPLRAGSKKKQTVEVAANSGSTVRVKIKFT